MTVQYRKILYERKGWMLQTPEGKFVLDCWSGEPWMANTKKQALEGAKKLRSNGTRTKAPIKVTLVIYADASPPRKQKELLP